MPNDIISLTEFKNDASGWIERLQSQPPIVLTQNGRGKAVVQSYESYQQQRFAMALLKRVIQGETDAKAGLIVPHEQVMADAEALIDTVATRTTTPPVKRRTKAVAATATASSRSRA